MKITVHRTTKSPALQRENKNVKSGQLLGGGGGVGYSGCWPCWLLLVLFFLESIKKKNKNLKITLIIEAKYCQKNWMARFGPFFFFGPTSGIAYRGGAGIIFTQRL